MSAILNFDLSPIAGLSSSQKYNGNTVSDIQSAYQTYQTGVPTGRGGQYAVSAQQKYGYASISDAAAGYLQAAGIPIISNAVAEAFPNSGSTGNGVAPSSTVTTPTDVTGASSSDLNTMIGSQIQTLSNAFAQAFGNAVYEPPFTSQYYSGSVPQSGGIYDPSQLSGYTSVPAGAAPAQASSGGGLKLILILGVIGVVGYLIYRHYKKA